MNAIGAVLSVGGFFTGGRIGVIMQLAGLAIAFNFLGIADALNGTSDSSGTSAISAPTAGQLNPVYA